MQTIADLTALLADNVTGDISPADVRELLDTLNPGHAAFWLADGDQVETVISGAGVFVESAGQLSSDPDSLNFSLPLANHIQWDGSVTIHCYIDVAFAMTASGNNKVLEFRIAANGDPYSEEAARSRMLRKVGIGGDVGAAAISNALLLEPGEYFSLWAANNSDTANLTIQALQMNVRANVL